MTWQVSPKVVLYGDMKLTFGISWCSLRASSFELKLWTRSLCVCEASFFTRSAIYNYKIEYTPLKALIRSTYSTTLNFFKPLLSFCFTWIARRPRRWIPIIFWRRAFPSVGITWRSAPILPLLNGFLQLQFRFIFLLFPIWGQKICN